MKTAVEMYAQAVLARIASDIAEKGGVINDFNNNRDDIDAIAYLASGEVVGCLRGGSCSSNPVLRANDGEWHWKKYSVMGPVIQWPSNAVVESIIDKSNADAMSSIENGYCAPIVAIREIVYAQKN